MTKNNKHQTDLDNTDEFVAADQAGTDDADDCTETPVVIASQHDPDAAWGYKTHKYGGDDQFYGYHEHTLVQVPDGTDPADTEPRLVVGVEVTPANADQVEPSLSILDRLVRPARWLMVDRLYPYARNERWRDPLHRRGIEQVFDLRRNQHGFTDVDGTLWAAGWPHCPATPMSMGTIERPLPSASPEDRDKFRRAIELRKQYAFRRVASPDEMGVARWECPAVAGTVGCPLRPGSIQAAMELTLPIIDTPPNPNSPDFPNCCSQRTVTLDPKHLRKLMQHYYWGSRLWEDAYNKRTYVEGSYGNRKNESTEDLRRGHHRLTGLVIVQLVVTLTAVAYNLRILRNWHQRTGRGDPTHPLLQERQAPGPWTYLSEEDAATVAAKYAPGIESAT